MSNEDLMKLSKEEEAALKRLEARYDIIRDNTKLVAVGGSSGLLVWGPGGGGKSFNVIDTLKQMGKEFILLNTRLSAAKLCKHLYAKQDGLFLCEDLEDLFTEKVCLSLLRSAFWGQEDETGVMIRPITYGTGSEEWSFDFEFKGAIIATMNSQPDAIPELRALKTRIDCCHLQGERDELFALGHKIALKGYYDVSVKDCVMMWDFWRKHWPEWRTPDLRVLPRIWRKYRKMMSEQLKLKTSWQDMLLSMINESVGDEPVDTPDSILFEREETAAKLRKMYGSDLDRILPEWKKLTGSSSKQTYYNALKRYDLKNRKG